MVELAGLMGWRHLHVRKSIGKGRSWVTATNLVGWPDLTLMRPPHDLVFAELKVPPNVATPEQIEMIEFLAGYPFAVARIWTPDDWDEIEAVLLRRP